MEQWIFSEFDKLTAIDASFHIHITKNLSNFSWPTNIDVYEKMMFIRVIGARVEQFLSETHKLTHMMIVINVFDSTIRWMMEAFGSHYVMMMMNFNNRREINIQDIYNLTTCIEYCRQYVCVYLDATEWIWTNHTKYLIKMMKEEDDILIKTSFWSRPTHDGSLSLIILIISTTTTLIHATTIFLDNQKKTPCYKSSGILERRNSPFLEEGIHTQVK